MSASEGVALPENETLVATPLGGSDTINGESRAAEEYETVQLEACEEDATVAKQQDVSGNESWTDCNISSKEPKEVSTAVPQSPAVSEITPVEEEEKPQFFESSAPIRILVSDPKRAEEVSKLGIRTSFMSYCVQSETSLPEYPFSKRAVWRRFKDFDMLHHLLRSNHRGFIIPALPPKSFFESKRGKDAFIKERQIELNKFLCKVAAHKGLYNTEELKIFLGYPEELIASHAWYRLIDSAKQLTETPDGGQTDLDKPAENMKRDVTAMIKKVGNTIKREMLPRSHSISDTERNLQDMVPKLKQLELHLSGAVEKSQSFMTLFGDTGNEMGILGRIWLTVGRFEEGFVEFSGQHSDLGQAIIREINAMHKSGLAAVRIQQICDKSSELLKGVFSVYCTVHGWMLFYFVSWFLARLNVLSEHLTLLPSVLLSLHDRTLMLRHLTESQDQLETSRRTLDNLTKDSGKKLGGASGFAAKSALLSQDIQSHVEEVSRRTEMYDIVTQRNLTELERHTNERTQDLLEMALSVSKTQQEFYETISLIWVNLAEEISRTMITEDAKDT